MRHRHSPTPPARQPDRQDAEALALTDDAHRAETDRGDDAAADDLGEALGDDLNDALGDDNPADGWAGGLPGQGLGLVPDSADAGLDGAAEACTVALAAWPTAPGARPRWQNAATPEQAEEARLLAEVMDQNADALARLYHRLSSAVYAQLLRSTRQVALAEELLEDVFWQVWRQAPRYDASRGSVRAWVSVIARSRALDALRAQRRNPLLAMDPLPDDAELHDSAGLDDPQDLLAASQSHSALHQALQRLDPMRRQLVSLAYFRGLTQQEVAEHTGLPLGTVKSHLRRALASLRDTLGPAAAPAQASGTPTT